MASGGPVGPAVIYGCAHALNRRREANLNSFTYQEVANVKLHQFG